MVVPATCTTIRKGHIVGIINYDKPVKDLINGLNATGHITHANDRKTMVTFHHNGGIFTHEQVLNIWKNRPASAHFDVDGRGNVAQYANVNDYAWACANTIGNRDSISIEMCNSTLAPKWLVAPTTWQSAARLAGWLFANVIKTPPTSANVVFHHHWYPTACAGPYMDSIYDELLATVVDAYHQFTAPAPHPAPSTLQRGSTGAVVASVQTFLMRVFPAYAGPIKTSGGADGVFGAGTDKVVREFQSRSHLVPDGVIGPKTWAALRANGYR